MEELCCVTCQQMTKQAFFCLSYSRGGGLFCPGSVWFWYIRASQGSLLVSGQREGLSYPSPSPGVGQEDLEALPGPLG